MTPRIRALIRSLGIPTKTYHGPAKSVGEGQEGCWWTGRVLMLWHRARPMTYLHEIAHFVRSPKEMRQYINYGLDLIAPPEVSKDLRTRILDPCRSREVSDEEVDVCYICFYLADKIGVSALEIEAEMHLCAFDVVDYNKHIAKGKALFRRRKRWLPR